MSKHKNKNKRKPVAVARSVASASRGNEGAHSASSKVSIGHASEDSKVSIGHGSTDSKVSIAEVAGSALQPRQNNVYPMPPSHDNGPVGMRDECVSIDPNDDEGEDHGELSPDLRHAKEMQPGQVIDLLACSAREFVRQRSRQVVPELDDVSGRGRTSDIESVPMQNAATPVVPFEV
jgi:hypothetical protein